MSEYKLSQGIIELSKASNWDQAKLEWSLDSIYKEEKPDTCLCSHFPIIEICILKNWLKKTAIVGNCCVKKFMGLPSDKIFQASKRVRSNNTKSLNAATIDHAFRNHRINE